MCKKEIPWTFKTWLANFIDVDLPIGDLARHFSNDPNFPTADGYKVLHNYILENSPAHGTTRCFEEVWKFYLATK